MNKIEEKTSPELDWGTIEHFFVKLFLQEGYNQQCAEILGFYVSQTLQNASPLLRIAQEQSQINSTDLDENELEETMLAVHMLFQNHENLQIGHKILKSFEVDLDSLWENVEDKKQPAE